MPDKQETRPFVYTGFGVVLLLLVGMVGQNVHLTRSYAGYPNAAVYTKVAQWLNQHAKPGATVACAEVGYLGYFTANPIHDLWGLTTPAVVPLVKQREFVAAFFQGTPAYFVYLKEQMPWRVVLESEEFQRQYAPVAVFDAPAPWNKCVIYARGSSKPPGAGIEREP